MSSKKAVELMKPFVYSGILHSRPAELDKPFITDEEVAVLFADISGTKKKLLNVQVSHR